MENVKNQIQIGSSFSVAYYGLIIGLAIIVGMLIVCQEAKRTGQDPDIYTDYIIWGVIAGVVGARLYYVLFQWDYYKNNPAEILNLRGGGLAIYGTVIGAVIALVIFCKVKKQNLLVMLDTLAPSLVLGQAMGRWGNFFNMEAFGRYTDNLFAMQLRLDLVNSGMLGGDVLDHIVTVNGVDYIQVHPTFLYESAGCLCIFIFLMIIRYYKKFDGEIICFYVALYGLLRFFIEGLRVDSLMFFGTGIRTSQLLAGICFIAGTVLLIIGFTKTPRSTEEAAGSGEDPGGSGDQK